MAHLDLEALMVFLPMRIYSYFSLAGESQSSFFSAVWSRFVFQKYTYKVGPLLVISGVISPINNG